MKKFLLLSTIGLMFSFSAHADEPDAQITFRVKDDAGNTATGAVVQMNAFERWVPGGEFGKDIHRRVEGMTDTNGMVILQMPSLRGSVEYGVSVNGEYFDNTMKMTVAGKTYYRDMGGSLHFTNHVAGKWQPWNPTVDIQLKEVVNPIPMFARSFVNRRPRLQIPEFGKAVGFDLMKGDWIGPYGKGEVSDLYFKLNVTDLGQRKIDRGPMFDATFSVTFASDADGIQEFFSHPLIGSTLRSPRFAPETGYSSVLVKTSYEHETENHHEKREDQNYFLRVRTKKDESGNVITALYGKIYGDIAYSSKGVLRFLYYLNPTANDRNLEFDPSRNLFTDLPSAEQVKDP